MGEEVAEYQGAYKVTQGLLDEFGPKRVIDTPITEYGFAGLGTGAAMGGLAPDRRVHDLQLRDAGDRPHHQFGGQDQLHVGRPDALPDRVPRPQRRGGARRRAAQPELRRRGTPASPGLIVIAPYNAADAKGLLKAAIRTEDPVVFLENELLYGQHFDVPQLDDYVLPIGKARIVREGKDVTIVSYSIGVGVALEAAQELMGEGIDAEVIDLRTLRPLDKATVLDSLKRTNRMVVVEEGWPTCSIAREIIAICDGRGLRRSRRAGAARDQRGRAAALCRQPREAGADQGVGGGRGGEGGQLSLSGRSAPTASWRSTYGRPRSRPASTPCSTIDAALGDVVRDDDASRCSGAIRLAWWRERLEELDAAPPPAEPRLAGGRARASAARRQRATIWRRWKAAGCAVRSRSRGRPDRRSDLAARAICCSGSARGCLDGRRAGSRGAGGIVGAGRCRAACSDCAVARDARSTRRGRLRAWPSRRARSAAARGR